MPRTALYVPGDRPDMLAKAVGLPADELIVDLEDAVAPDRKDLALTELVSWLGDLDGAAGPPLWVRVNPTARWPDEVTAVLATGRVAGICRPKTASADDVRALADLLDTLRSPAGIAAILEDAAAVLGAREIAAASPRVVRLQLGEADLCATAGITPGPDESELLWARSQIVLASAAAGISAPLGPVSTSYRDLDRLRETTERLRRLGFGGRACIHPAQLPVVREVFTPTEAELAAARRTLELFERSRGGATSGADGSLVDEALARQARALIARRLSS